MDLILFAVPFFFGLIALELVADRARGRSHYRLNDSLTSLATGSISQLVAVAQKLVPFAAYVLVYEQFAMFDLGDSAVIWVIAFVLYDFCYYWVHRFGHEVNILWAAHVVHHSSEEYNLTTALRQTGSGFLTFVFYLPLAVLGIDPVILVTVGALNLIYQFWVHTQHIGKLGWYEKIFVTPSNHRAHHAQNTVYIDRNYGGVFIIWDRLFGSYQEELDDDPVVYGIRGAVQTWNPLWVNWQVYNQLCWDAIHTKNWWHKLTLWFRRTGWRPPDVSEAYPVVKNDDLSLFKKFETQISMPLKAHCLIQYIATALISLSFATGAPDMELLEQVGLVGFVLVSSYSIGVMMENRYYSAMLETIRLSALLIAVAWLPMSQTLAVFLGLSALIGMPLLFIGRQKVLGEEALDQSR